MRSLFAVSLLAFFLASGSLAAQSLEESYAQLCSRPDEARTEACQVLAKSLVAKLQGQQTPQSPPSSAQAAAIPEVSEAAPELVGMQRWGFFADLVDQELTDIQYENPGNVAIASGIVKYVWDVPGEVMGVLEKQTDGTFKRGATLQWDAARRGLRETTPGAETSILLVWQPDGSFVANLDSVRLSFRPIPDGAIELLIEGDKGQGWELMNRRHRVEATPAMLETQALIKQIEANTAETNKLMAEVKKKDAELKASPLWQQTLIARAHAEAERERKREASNNRWSAVMGALDGALDVGLEVTRAQEAQSRYELDSTLAELNSRIAAQQAQQVQPSSANQAAYTAPPAPAPVATPPVTSRYQALQGAGTGSWASAGQGASSSGAATVDSTGAASTRDDASSCVSPPVTSTHKCTSLSGYKALVSNTCAVPVDVKVCFMTAKGWNCQSNYGLAPQATWEPGWCHANTGEVFHSVRYSDSKEPLRSP